MIEGQAILFEKGGPGVTPTDVLGVLPDLEASLERAGCTCRTLRVIVRRMNAEDIHLDTRHAGDCPAPLMSELEGTPKGVG